MRTLFVASLLLVLGLSPPVAAGPEVYTLTTDSSVERITASGDRIIIRTLNAKSYSLHLRQGAFSLEPDEGYAPPTPARPLNSLPDGEITVGSGDSGEIRRAWLSAPTLRYDHGVLGDDIEAGALSVELTDGRVVTYTLPEDSVFEDRIPRLVDINVDGKNEVLLVRSYLNRGAALVVIALNDGKLEIVAEARPIGLAHRWLNPVGIGDFDDDGITEIAAVITPHIGGTLQLYEMRGNRLVEDLSLHGFSNHQMGSRNLGLSAVADVDGNGVPDIVAPDASRENLVGLTFQGGKPVELFRVPLSARITSPMQSADLDQDGRDEVIFGIAPNRLIVFCLHP